MQIKLEKYHGLGNDYLVYDPAVNPMELTPGRIRLICNRNFGPGSDGILYGPIFENGAIKVKIFNPDGGEAEKSGNGVRIFSKYLKDAKYISEKQFTVSTLGGDVDVTYLTPNGDVMRVMMGKGVCRSDLIPVSGPSRQVINEEMVFCGKPYRVTCVSVGNPHCVIPMDQVSRETVCELGPFVEHSPMFPNRINLQILKVLDGENIQIEIYERGAGYTLASGSSSCAAAFAAYRLGLTGSKIGVHMPGGKLEIEIRRDDSIYMTGQVQRVCSITLAEEFVGDLQRK